MATWLCAVALSSQTRKWREREPQCTHSFRALVWNPEDTLTRKTRWAGLARVPLCVQLVEARAQGASGGLAGAWGRAQHGTRRPGGVVQCLEN
jgi:hypothetical protein